MRLDSLAVQTFRNIEGAELLPDPELTVIAGKNGQGKTNLLESIWLLTGGKSFRGSRDYDLVKKGDLFAKIEGVAQTEQKENRLGVTVAGVDSGKRGRYAKVNGVDYGRASNIAGIFTAVVFDPNHLNLVKGGPDGRRRFLDAALCQLYPGYISVLRRYSRALTQKNALLKKYREIPDVQNMLDAFDEELALSGEEMTKRRKDYLAMAAPAAEEVYGQLTAGVETLQINYIACCPENGLAALLRQSRRADMRAGFSTVGPHREDFETLISGEKARVFGSQGQQRSAVLSLKIAEGATAQKVTGEHPVMLLDDVLSELDETRQTYLLSRIKGKQTFVTSCDAGAFGRTAGKIIKVEKGRVG